MPLTVPSRIVTIDGEPTVLQADLRAIFTLEETSDLTTYAFCQRHLLTGCRYLGTAQMLFAFTATGRKQAAKAQKPPTVPDDFETYSEKLVLPNEIDEFKALSKTAFNLLMEAIDGGSTKNAPVPADEPPASPASSGSGSTTSSPSPSGARKKHSGK